MPGGLSKPVMDRSHRRHCYCRYCRRHCPRPGCYRRCCYEKMVGREVRQGKGGGVVERWRSDRPRDPKCRYHPQTASDRLPLSRRTACNVALGCVLGATIFFCLFVVIVEEGIRLGSFSLSLCFVLRCEKKKRTQE